LLFSKPELLIVKLFLYFFLIKVYEIIPENNKIHIFLLLPVKLINCGNGKTERTRVKIESYGPQILRGAVSVKYLSKIQKEEYLYSYKQHKYYISCYLFESIFNYPAKVFKIM